MAAPFRERVRLSVYGVRAILRCRGTVPASIGHRLAACPVTASPASWPEPGGCPGGVTARARCRVHPHHPDTIRDPRPFPPKRCWPDGSPGAGRGPRKHRRGKPFPQTRIAGRHGNKENPMRNPTPVDGDRHQSPMPSVLDSAGRARQRVLAPVPPHRSRAVYQCRGRQPPRHRPADHQPGHRAQGTDDCRASPDSALRLRLADLLRAGGAGRLLRGDRHPGQEPWFGHCHHRRADRGNRCLLRSSHQCPGRVQSRRGCDSSHVLGRGRAVPGHHRQLPGLSGVRCRLLHRHLRRAGAHGVCPLAESERAALAGGLVLRRLELAQQLGSIGPVRVILLTFPLAVAMVLLAARIWRAAAPPASLSPEPVAVPVSSP